MNCTSIGSISHGTLRTEDLLEAFASELEYQMQSNAEEWCSDEGRKERDGLCELVGQAREIDPDHEDAAELVWELTAALEQFAPAYTYFGAHEGDGSDFGFWPAYDAIEDEVRGRMLSSGDETPCACCFEGDYFWQVNERGNGAMYQRVAEPAGQFTHWTWVELWSVV